MGHGSVESVCSVLYSAYDFHNELVEPCRCGFDIKNFQECPSKSVDLRRVAGVSIQESTATQQFGAGDVSGDA